MQDCPLPYQWLNTSQVCGHVRFTGHVLHAHEWTSLFEQTYLHRRSIQATDWCHASRPALACSRALIHGHSPLPGQTHIRIFEQHCRPRLLPPSTCAGLPPPRHRCGRCHRHLASSDTPPPLRHRRGPAATAAPLGDQCVVRRALALAVTDDAEGGGGAGEPSSSRDLLCRRIDIAGELGTDALPELRWPMPASTGVPPGRTSRDARRPDGRPPASALAARREVPLGTLPEVAPPPLAQPPPSRPAR